MPVYLSIPPLSSLCLSDHLTRCKLRVVCVMQMQFHNLASLSPPCRLSPRRTELHKVICDKNRQIIPSTGTTSGVRSSEHG